MNQVVRWCAAFFALGFVGCSSSGGAAAAATVDAAESCSGGSAYPTDSYSPNMSRRGTAGGLTFILASANPAPPGTYTNTWTVKLVDGSGAPVTDATFPSIKTWMPLHGHSSSVVPTATSNGDGTYTISLYLFMPGLWQITLNAQSATTTDSAMFTFCVDQ